MKINKVLAQEIADKVMSVIPYKVNIMDENGLIIGSGDKKRVGTIHEGAVSAIEQGTMITIYKPEGSSKPGVNIPIHFQNMTIGVIGISGDPRIVAPFAELVRVTAELLIGQEFLFKERRIKEQRVEEFLYHWAFRNDEYDTDFFNSAEAIGVNLKLVRKAVIIKGKLRKQPSLFAQEFTFKLNQESHLFIVPDTSDIVNRLEPLIAQDSKIGIGDRHEILAKSVQEAKRAIEISESLKFAQNISDYPQLKFIDYLTNKNVAFDEIIPFYAQLEENQKGQELLETLLCFIENSGDMNAISYKLHIHRNSLAYRLQRIEILTNKNPKNFIDLFQLFTGYVLYKMKHSS
ncbi:sugar diacid recognition domain-containing protein [Neobacillus novalis]|uniref:Sugar diacid recognition domain-containing protein n=1 Tax=Neobacillus novalis TaxID=220687 RepID=A0AA95MR42_9BACI|nr:sugar diacid recognition domain-containing protein [Neobacillus novalis]WHY86829.1 sugar diacid recognition domain-containing protein [Neobacillus novalis]